MDSMAQFAAEETMKRVVQAPDDVCLLLGRWQVAHARPDPPKDELRF